MDFFGTPNVLDHVSTMAACEAVQNRIKFCEIVFKKKRVNLYSRYTN